MNASVILRSVPCSDRVPPPILRLMTRWRMRSAALLSAGTSGSAEEFLDVALDRHSLAWVATGRAGRVGRGPAVGVPGPVGRCAAAWPGDECRLWPGRKSHGRRRPTWPVAHHRGRGCAGHGCPAAEPAPGLNRGGPSSVAWGHHNGGRRRRSLTNTPEKASLSASSTTVLPRPRRRK